MLLRITPAIQTVRKTADKTTETTPAPKAKSKNTHLLSDSATGRRVARPRAGPAQAPSPASSIPSAPPVVNWPTETDNPAEASPASAPAAQPAQNSGGISAAQAIQNLTAGVNSFAKKHNTQARFFNESIKSVLEAKKLLSQVDWKNNDRIDQSQIVTACNELLNMLNNASSDESKDMQFLNSISVKAGQLYQMVGNQGATVGVAPQAAPAPAAKNPGLMQRGWDRVKGVVDRLRPPLPAPYTARSRLTAKSASAAAFVRTHPNPIQVHAQTDDAIRKEWIENYLKSNPRLVNPEEEALDALREHLRFLNTPKRPKEKPVYNLPTGEGRRIGEPGPPPSKIRYIEKMMNNGKSEAEARALWERNYGSKM